MPSRRCFLSFAVVLSVVACSFLTISIDRTAAQSFNGVTLHILVGAQGAFTNSTRWTNDQVKQMWGLAVEQDEVPYGELFDKAMSSQIAGTNAYDLVTLPNQFYAPFVDGKYLEPLDVYVARDHFELKRFPPLPLKWGYQDAGKTWGLPFNVEARVSFYRKDIFDAEGLKQPMGDTEGAWKQYIELMKKFRNDPKLRSKYPDVWGPAEMYGKEQINYVWSLYAGLFAEAHPNIQTPNYFWDYNHKNITDKALMAKALRMLNDAKQYMPGGVESWNLPELDQAILKGRVLRGDSWPSSFAADTLDPTKCDVVGKLSGTTAIGKPVVGGWGISMFASSRNKDAAWAYIKYILDPKNDAMFFEKYGKGPANLSVWNDPAMQKKYYWFPAEAAALQKGMWIGTMAHINDLFSGDFTIMMQEGEIGSATPETAAESIYNAVTKALVDSGYPQ